MFIVELRDSLLRIIQGIFGMNFCFVLKLR